MLSEYGYMKLGNTRSFGPKNRGTITVHNKDIIFRPLKEKYGEEIGFKFSDIKNVSHPKRRGTVFELNNGKIYTFAASSTDVPYVNEFSNIQRTVVGNRRNELFFQSLRTLIDVQ